MLIDKIYITHRLTFPKGTKNEAYLSGRRFSGIVLAVSGAIDYIFDGGKRVRLEAGQMMYLPALSVYGTENPDEDFEHFTLNFGLQPIEGREADASPADLRIHKAMFGKSATVITPESLAETKLLFEKAIASRHGQTLPNDLLCRSVIYELLYMFCCELSESHTDNRAKLPVMPAKTYIDENFTGEFGMDFLAGLCSMSETHFRRCFCRAFGATPADYRQGLRIARAKELLLTRLYKIFEVAELCGYNDANYFTRIFKLKVGVTPQEYMNSM